jgi:hypothetical protein
MHYGPKLHWIAGIALLSAVVGCSTPSAALGPDRATRSDASAVTWTDGQPAYAIKCEAASGCQSRTAALCNHGPSTLLSSENLPTAGSARAALGQPSVVVRCG